MSHSCTIELRKSRFCRRLIRFGTSAITVLVCSILSVGLYADITLAKLFSDHMVLQRNDSVRVWGTANPEEKLTIKFFAAGASAGDEQQASAMADPHGRWSTLIKTGKAGQATYTLEVSVEGSDTKVVVSDILLGEVWICAGESNMLLPLGKTCLLYTSDAADE